MINPGLLAERIPTVKGPRTAVFWDAVDYPFPPSSTLSHQLLLKGILVIRLQSGPILMMMTRKGLPYWVTGRGLPESTFFPEVIIPPSFFFISIYLTSIDNYV
ncbi:unnamed protein product [Brassica napus]|uniref:(rape) hypothetical protein n=1 Tax=Brassica napus TaxID=3708 RepID=A0A816JYZ5_BRANA|nr:unnamed protein product [Brassica napus]